MKKKIIRNSKRNFTKTANWIECVQKLASEKRALLQSIKPPLESPSRYIQPEAAREFPLHWLTYEYLNLTLDFDLTENFNWRDHAAKAGEYYARQGLDHLTELVFAGDTKALAALADIATAATKTLNDLSRHAPEQVQPIACRRFFWPFLKARNERFGDDHKKLVKEIGLGDEAPFSVEAVARVRPTNIAVRIAMTLLCRLESYRHKNPALEDLMSAPLPEWKAKAMRLEPFSAGTCPDWVEVAWQALLSDCNGHPERDPELKNIGLYRADHSTDRYSGSQRVATAKTRNTNIKDGIREKLKKAIQRLSKSPNKSQKK